jgi:uncharacterized membrane protein
MPTPRQPSGTVRDRLPALLMSSGSRLGYIDWLRGLAVLGMMLVHAFNGWLTPEAKQTGVYYWIRTAGGYPAPLFLFLAGLSLALLLEGRRRHGQRGAAILREGVRRGVEVVGWAFLFRLWMLATGGFATPGDLTRVDVLNCIGASMALVGLAALGWDRLRTRVAACVTVALLTALLAPFAWDASWPAWIPVPLLGYVNGRAAGSLFPLLPWAGFTAAGAAAGLLLADARHTPRETWTVAAMAAAGVAAVPLAQALERSGPALYPHSDFWHTSPLFFLMRLGVVCALLGLAHLLGRRRGFSPLRQLGRTSLLIYWVHVEVVYGKLLLPDLRHGMDMRATACAFVLLVLGMLALSTWRTHVGASQKAHVPSEA